MVLSNGEEVAPAFVEAIANADLPVWPAFLVKGARAGMFLGFP